MTNGLGTVFMQQLIFFGIGFFELFLLFSVLLAFVYGIRMLFNLSV